MGGVCMEMTGAAQGAAAEQVLCPHCQSSFRVERGWQVSTLEAVRQFGRFHFSLTESTSPLVRPRAKLLFMRSQWKKSIKTKKKDTPGRRAA